MQRKLVFFDRVHCVPLEKWEGVLVDQLIVQWIEDLEVLARKLEILNGKPWKSEYF